MSAIIQHSHSFVLKLVIKLPDASLCLTLFCVWEKEDAAVFLTAALEEALQL